MTASFSFLGFAIIFAIAIAAYVALIASANLLRKTRNLRFGRAYHAFAIAAALLAALHYGPKIIGMQPLWVGEVLPHLTAIALVLAAFPAVTLINRILWVHTGPNGKVVEAPRVLADTTGLLVFIAIALGMMHLVYGVKVPGLLAGSGVIAIILGLAMQDLLGNIFGGLSLYLEKPFKPGDWLRVENQDARVVEITWRSTRLLTNDDVMLDVPNATIVKNTITNYEKPTCRHALHASIGLHFDVPPTRAQAVLREATASVPGVVDSPKPVVHVREFQESSINYDIKFWIDDHRFAQRILSDVRSHAWYAVRRAGIEIPFPIVTLHRARSPDDSRKVARALATQALRNHKIFSFLNGDQIDDLVQHSEVVLFAPQEHIIEQAAVGDSMFLLVKGRAEVRVAHGDKSDVVATFGPGDCCGEMSLLTDEPRSATIMALEEVDAVKITHSILTPLIHETPEVLNRLSELLAERQAANEQLFAAAMPAHEKRARQATILHRLRGFFLLGQ